MGRLHSCFLLCSLLLLLLSFSQSRIVDCRNRKATSGYQLLIFCLFYWLESFARLAAIGSDCAVRVVWYIVCREIVACARGEFQIKEEYD